MNPAHLVLALFFLVLSAMPVLAQQQTEALLLVARPQIRGSMFTESVVLVTRHGRSRPMGVILNKPSDIRFGGQEDNGTAARQLNLGGPVSPQTLVYVFRDESSIEGRPDLLRLGSGLYMGMGEAAMMALLKQQSAVSLRAFAGISSWAHGQLESEISRGDWLVLPFDAEAVMQTDTGSLWKDLIARASQRRI